MNDLITTYWAQIVVFLTCVGFIIKTIVEAVNKKKDTDRSLFQNHRINAVAKFLDSYSLMERMYVELPVMKIINYELSPKETDGMIQPRLAEMNRAVLEIAFYFDNNIKAQSEKIFKNFSDINHAILNEKHLSIQKAKIEKINNVHFFMESRIDENKKLLVALLRDMKKVYSF